MSTVGCARALKLILEVGVLAIPSYTECHRDIRTDARTRTDPHRVKIGVFFAAQMLCCSEHLSKLLRGNDEREIAINTSPRTSETRCSGTSAEMAVHSRMRVTAKIKLNEDAANDPQLRRNVGNAECTSHVSVTSNTSEWYPRETCWCAASPRPSGSRLL